jgi:hypothetical protein
MSEQAWYATLNGDEREAVDCMIAADITWLDALCQVLPGMESQWRRSQSHPKEKFLRALHFLSYTGLPVTITSGADWAGMNAATVRSWATRDRDFASRIETIKANPTPILERATGPADDWQFLLAGLARVKTLPFSEVERVKCGDLPSKRFLAVAWPTDLTDWLVEMHDRDVAKNQGMFAHA